MKWPVVPTLLVGLAVAAMIGLGLWQLLVRLPEKEAELARLAANPSQPAVAFPATAGAGEQEQLLFRRATLDCRAPVTIARAGAGQAGYRLIATCAGGAMAQLGTTRDPGGATGWAGGMLLGRIGHAPDPRPLIARVFDKAPPALILIADRPAPGLAANRVPGLGSVPNNHLAYAVQWFLFAAIAGVIYLLALRRRGRS